MKLFYLIATCALGLILIILSVAQFGVSCSWNLISFSNPVIVLLLTALLGAFMGAFFLLFLLTPKEKEGEGMDE